MAALRQLIFKVSADGLVEMRRFSDSLIEECQKRFNGSVVKSFEKEHLRLPTIDDATVTLARRGSSASQDLSGRSTVSDGM